MFLNNSRALDGSTLSEQALPMAQHLARSSATSLHPWQVISLRPELEAMRGSGSESVTVLEMAQDAARRLREAQMARGQAYLEGLGAAPARRSSCHHGPTGRCCRRAHRRVRQGTRDRPHRHEHPRIQRIQAILPWECDRPGHPCRPDACAGRARLVKCVPAPPSPALCRRGLKTGGNALPVSIPWISLPDKRTLVQPPTTG